MHEPGISTDVFIHQTVVRTCSKTNECKLTASKDLVSILIFIIALILIPHCGIHLSHICNW